MKGQSFESRLAEVMPNMVEVGDDGVARPSAAFIALERDLTAALAGPLATPELQDMARALVLMKDTLLNPEMAMSIASAQSTDFVPNPEIFDAIEDQDVDAVREALKDWDINQTFGEFESTALYHAMSCSFGGSLEVMHLLLDAGADPRKGLTDTNVLHGLGFGYMPDIDPADLAKVILRCVEKGADIEERSQNLKWTPLITAASEWNPVATEALLLAGADITARAGDVEGVCFAGEDCLAFADGHDETTAVLKRYLGAQ